MSGIRSLSLRARIYLLCVAFFFVPGFALVMVVIPRQSGRSAGLAFAFASTAFVVGAILVARTVAVRVTRPLWDLVERAGAVTRGEIPPSSEPPRMPEVRALADAIDSLGARAELAETNARRLAEALAQVAGPLQESGGRLGFAIATLVERAAAAERGASEQAASADRARASASDLLVTSREVAVASEAAGLVAERTRLAATAAESGVTKGIAGLEQLASTSRKAAERLSELSELNRHVSAIVDVLDDLADRTDLIALDAGRGAQGDEPFAAVSTRMRALAENVAESARAIKPLIIQVQQASAACLLASGGHVRAVDRATQDGARMDEHVRALVQLAAEIGDATRHVASTAMQQRTGTEQVVQDMGDLAAASRGTVEGAGRTTAAADDVARIGGEIEAAVRRARPGGRADAAG